MMQKQSTSLSVIVAVFGRFSVNQIYVGEVKSVLQTALDASAEIVFVFAGECWKTLPSVQTLESTFDRASCIFLSEDALPAKLYNTGALASTGSRLMFLSPDLPCEGDQISLLSRHGAQDPDGSDIIAVSDKAIEDKFRLPHEANDTLAHGWLLNAPVFDLSNVCIPSASYRSIGMFDESPILQQQCGWDLLVRLTTACALRVVGKVHTKAATISAADFSRPFPISQDMRRRYIARAFCGDREAKFIADLPHKEASYLKRNIPALSGRLSDGNPLRITITGSFWEHHHNWLCFLNYLHHLEGQGVATHRCLFDHLVEQSDIEDSDIVILSRCKVDEIRQILNWCDETDVSSIYMIDDNWLTVAQDWPIPYKEIFSPGKPQYDNFIYGVSNSNFVLTYNRLMQEDIAPIARKVITLPNSVDLDLFERTPRKDSPRFLVGYSGSPRYSSAPFKALARISRENPDVEILLFGTLNPEHERELFGCSVTRVPQTSYSRYADIIRSYSPDILLAPMDDSRTSRSKCPNKYLEITAAGAVGIYSEVEPYTWYVNHGVNGVFVSETDDEGAWVSAISDLLNKDKLHKLHSAARENIINNFTVTKVAPQFANLLHNVSVGKS